MSEKKMVRRSVAIALGIVCIILVAALGVVTFMGYSPTATNSVPTLQSQINQLQTWLDGNKTLLNQTKTWLEGNNTNYNSQILDLQNQIASLKAPKLIKVDLHSDDGGLPFESRSLHIYGSVVNVGTNPAYNSKLHVVAYVSQVVAIDTYIQLNTINGESFKYIDQTITYSGGTPLSSWTITPEWTNE
jgi:hypothetical protein